MPDHIEVAIGDGIEGAGIQRDAGHKLVYPAAGGPASQPASRRRRQAIQFYISRAPEPIRDSRVYPADRLMFRPSDGDETKLGPDETISGPREDIPKPAPCSS
jgi:hypothetical protein